MADQYILGISAFYHDSAACLLRNGEIVAAGQEERFTRKKGDASFPSRAVAYCLDTAGISIDDVTYVGFYDKPLLKFERILETYLGVAPRGFRSFLMAGPLWIKDKLFIDKQLRNELRYKGEILYSEHHESHAASAFFPSPFEQAAILTIDGVGEWATASIGRGAGNDIEVLEELHWPDSLGLLYSAFTYYTGFKVNSGEYKVMGLAPYGEPKYVDLIYKELMELRDDGSFRLNQKYFNYLTGLTMTNGEFDKLFGGPPRQPESKLTQKEMDLARSVPDSAGVRMLPALAGLGAPWWRPDARGLVEGLGLHTTRAHIARAAVDAIVWRVTDIVAAIGRTMPVVSLRMDGGASAVPQLGKWLADATGATIERMDADATCAGAAGLAAVGAGIWSSTDEIAARVRPLERFVAGSAAATRAADHEAWTRFVERALD